MRHCVSLFIKWQWRHQVAVPGHIESLAVADDKIKLRIYIPEGCEPFPVMVYYHGGGFVLGGIEASDRGCRDLCCKAGIIVVSVEYRLAPEYPFPAAVDDSLSAFDWVQNNIERYSGDSSLLFVGGDSAGGNLAAVVAQQRKNSGITGQLLFYPVLDFSEMNRSSYQANSDQRWLTGEMMKWFRRLYLVDETQWLDERASPLLNQSLTGLPPALLIAAGIDPLYDEGALYVIQLKEAGVETDYQCFANEHHGFYGFFGRTPAYEKAVTIVVKWIAEKIQTMKKSEM